MDGKVSVGFDGDCLMCSRGMRFLAEHDPRKRFRFLKLQSERGRRMEEQAGETGLKTMLVEADGRIYSRSAAILRCLQAMGGVWSLLAAAGRIFPGRDWLYDLIARNRQRFFKGSVCALPSPALLERMASDGDGI
ncbi:MAG: hypothetical protein JWO82_2361 [Akkermansiaceae bacterium]|nr:hypothetical protein [Akkermansiaceae bacterium]